MSVDTLLDAVNTEAEHASAWCDGDYTTNLPLADLTDGQAWIAFEDDGQPLEPEQAVRLGYWRRTCTSGRARSGYAA